MTATRKSWRFASAAARKRSNSSARRANRIVTHGHGGSIQHGLPCPTFFCVTYAIGVIRRSPSKARHRSQTLIALGGQLHDLVDEGYVVEACLGGGHYEFG